MSISFSGLASGLDTSGWVDAMVSIKQQKVTAYNTELSAIKNKKSTLTATRTVFNNFRTAIEKFTDAKFGGTFDVFTKNTAKSSNEAVFTAKANEKATRQNYDITVEQLATYTKAVSKNSVSAVADDDTKLSQLGITEGSLTAYVNGAKTTIEIGKDDTFGDLKARLAEAGVKTEVNEDGLLSFSSFDGTKDISIGATTDGSNLVSLVGLEKQEDGTYLSTNSLFKASVASKLTDPNSGFNEQITAGTFKIGDATFTIDENTTLSGLISSINNNKDAQAYAYWDDATGKLSITSKKEGASYINIEAGTSNFTDVMEFTETERDADGNIISSKMFTDAQELGKNAIFTVNGTKMTSTSNTVTEDISRIEGVTLTLNKVSSEEDGVSKLTVEQDTTDLIEAVKSFVSTYNDVIAKIDEVTANGADLQRETNLTSFKNTIRTYANGSNTSNGGAFKLLADIGISTGKADGNNISSDNTNTLVLDEAKLKEALAKDPESVRSLLAGENGVLSMMEDSVEQTLSASTGFFDVKEKTLNSDIQKMETKIKKQTESVTKYRAQLEKKFNVMEQMIAKMQQNYSSFL